MIYKVTFHISTLYIPNLINSKITYSSRYERKRKEEKLIHDFIQMETKYCIMGRINQDNQ